MYRTVDKGGAQTCGYNYCLNFLLRRDSVYPPEVVAFFEAVGIDYHKRVQIVSNVTTLTKIIAAIVVTDPVTTIAATLKLLHDILM